VAGALEENEFSDLLLAAGFSDVEIEPTRVYQAEEARSFLEGAGLDPDLIAGEIEGKFLSAFVRAKKPTA
jgi:hypothetical protein